MQRTANVEISDQAKIIAKHIKDFDEEKFLRWFCLTRGVFAGGGDLIDYIKYCDSKGEQP